MTSEAKEDACLRDDVRRRDQQDGEVRNGGRSEMERERHLKTGKERSQRDGNPGHGTAGDLRENDGGKEDHVGPSRVWEAGGLTNEPSREEGDGELACRICQSAKEEEVIRIGCNCKGDLALAHPSCAKEWFESKRSNVCEICREIAKGIPDIVIHDVPSGELSQDHGRILNQGGNPASSSRLDYTMIIYFFSVPFLLIFFFIGYMIVELIKGIHIMRYALSLSNIIALSIRAQALFSHHALLHPMLTKFATLKTQDRIGIP